MFALIKVRGLSMTPTLNPGDYIVIKQPRSLRPGFIYVMDHPRHGRIVKRLTKIEGETANYDSDGPDGSSGSLPISSLTHRAMLAITRTGLKRL